MEVGRGTHGVVRVAQLNGKFVATKVIAKTQPGTGVSVTALREIRMLARLTHRHIVALVGIECHGNSLHIQMEYHPISLRQLMRGPIVVDVARRYTRHLLLALTHCHAKCVMHRDVKPENLLVACCGDLKLADFGLARDVLHESQHAYTPGMVTLWYRSIEILRGENYSYGVDIWSVGCVVWEMLTGEALFPGTSELDMLHRIANTNLSHRLVDERGQQFVASCFTELAAQQALKHPFLTSSHDNVARTLDSLCT